MSAVSSLSALGKTAFLPSRRVAASSRNSAAAAAVPIALTRRFLSTTPPKPTGGGGGSSFFQRIGAFLTGAGLGCGFGYYHLSKEIAGSTAALEKAVAKSHRDLSDRLSKLEKR